MKDARLCLKLREIVLKIGRSSEKGVGTALLVSRNEKYLMKLRAIAQAHERESKGILDGRVSVMGGFGAAADEQKALKEIVREADSVNAWCDQIGLDRIETYSFGRGP
jgi:hypothetical protein